MLGASGNAAVLVAGQLQATLLKPFSWNGIAGLGTTPLWPIEQASDVASPA
jgi:hypothetical protein